MRARRNSVTWWHTALVTYRQGMCDNVSGGGTYALIGADKKSGFTTSDEYQASHLIDKAVNELCPAQIWQLPNLAAYNEPPPG
jgi:hypothetical protein